MWLYASVWLFAALSVVVFVAFVLAKFVIGQLFATAVRQFPREIVLIMTVAVAFLMLVVSTRVLSYANHECMCTFRLCPQRM